MNQSLSSFIRMVRIVASTTINNSHAGTTSEETNYITRYYWENQKLNLSVAVEQCSMTMLETFRATELPDNNYYRVGFREQNETLH